MQYKRREVDKMYIIYFIVSLFFCIIGSIGGIGGGFIIKPIVSAFGTLGIREVSFLSACTVLAMTIMTLIRSRKFDVKIDKRKSTILAIGAVIGGIIGKIIFQKIGESYGNFKIVGGILLFSTFKYFIYNAWTYGSKYKYNGIYIYGIRRNTRGIYCTKYF